MICDHSWYWRRRRNETRGYWECSACGARTGWHELDDHGRPIEGPPQPKPGRGRLDRAIDLSLFVVLIALLLCAGAAFVLLGLSRAGMI